MKSTLLAFTVLAATTLSLRAYDAADDFSNSNPSGVWSYGYTTTLASTFLIYDTFVTGANSGQIDTWRASSIGPDPQVVKNIVAYTYLGIAPGQLGLHPGPGGQLSVLRFTATTTSNYEIDVNFFQGDSGETQGYIVLNSNYATPLFYTAATSTQPSYLQTVALTAGNTVDIVIGSTDSYTFDMTPVTASIQAVPEPSTVAALSLGAVLFTAIRLRRRFLRA